MLERAHAVQGGRRGVVTKLVHEADEIINANEPLDDNNRGRLSIITETCWKT